MKPRWTRTRIATHPCALNLMLLSSTPDEIGTTADGVREKILELRGHYKGPSVVEWLPGLRLRRGAWTSIEAFYIPRTYACLGVFDVATVYISPAISHPFPPADQFPGAGQHVHMCLLPQLRGGDFNREFIEDYKKDCGPGRLPPEQRFLAAIKLKLNPSLTWPRPKDPLPHRRFQEVLAQTAATIETWRSHYRTGKKPLVANSLVDPVVPDGGNDIGRGPGGKADDGAREGDDHLAGHRLEVAGRHRCQRRSHWNEGAEESEARSHAHHRACRGQPAAGAFLLLHQQVRKAAVAKRVCTARIFDSSMRQTC